MLLLMNHPGGRRHPLHVAGANLAMVAGRVAMLQLPLIDNGDGLKAAVRNGLENHSYIVQIARKSGGCVRSTETAIQALPLRKSAITHAHQPPFLPRAPM